MTTKSHVRHVLFIALTALASVLVEVLAPAGALGHYQWSAPLFGAIAWAVRAFNLRSGPPAAAVLFMAVGLACGGATCHSLGPVPPGDAGTLTDCSESALHQAEISLIPQVENALALADYASVTAALATIVAATVGAPLALAEVTCVVDWAVSKAELARAQRNDPLSASQAAFGARWVLEHGANVKPAAIQ